MTKQKLQARFKNTLRNAPQVPNPVNLGLNRVQRLSDQGIVRTCNNPEEDHPQHKGGSDLRVQNIVYVLNQRGKPLMPTCQAKARHLLKKGKANVVKRFPFTIQLKVATGETKQPLTLGVDPGYANVGLSVISEKKRLFSAEVKLRTNIPKLLAERKMYRQKRREGLWYRKPRFNNRKIKKRSLRVSIQCKLDSHIRLIDKTYTLLPITKIIVESAPFDIQKIINPYIKGEEYCDGVQKGFWNVREYVLCRDNHKCRNCGKTNCVLEVHHIETRKTGSNRPDNLITLCDKCHKGYHLGKIKLNIKATKGFKAESCMQVISKRLVELLKQKYKNVEHTFGYITKSKRIELKLEKSHSNDAFTIAGGAFQEGCPLFSVAQKRKNNRCTQLNRNGFKPAIKQQRYTIQPYDILTVCGKEYVSKGISGKGRQVVCTNWIGNKVIIPTKLVDNVFHVGSLVWS